MTTKRAFERALAQWEATRLTATDDDYVALESAEKIVLSYRPMSLADAASMLEIIIEQRGDGRSDGLDLRAMERIVALLRAGTSMVAPRVRASGSVVAFQGRQA